MACIHLTQLYQLCQEQNLHFSSSHLVRIVCNECGKVDVCPSHLTGAAETDEQEDRRPDAAPAQATRDQC